MLIGYMRVSTADQSLDLQRDALLAADVSPDRIYEDVCSGKSTERPGLARALDVARDGDAIVVGSSTASDARCRTSLAWWAISRSAAWG